MAWLVIIISFSLGMYGGRSYFALTALALFPFIVQIYAANKVRAEIGLGSLPDDRVGIFLVIWIVFAAFPFGVGWLCRFIARRIRENNRSDRPAA